MRLEVAEVRAKAQGQWGWLAPRLAPSLAEAAARGPRRSGPCPVHGGRDGFRVFGDFEETGGAVCNTCGKFSDGLALLMWTNGWKFRETLEAVAVELGFEVRGRAPCAPPPAPPKGRAQNTTQHAEAKRGMRAQSIRERIRRKARKPGLAEVKI